MLAFFLNMGKLIEIRRSETIQRYIMQRDQAKVIISDYKQHLIRELNAALHYDQLPSRLTIDKKQISKDQATDHCLKIFYEKKEDLDTPWYPSIIQIEVLSQSKKDKLLKLTDSSGRDHTLLVTHLVQKDRQLTFTNEYPSDVDDLPKDIADTADKDSIPKEKISIDMDDLEGWKMLPYLTANGWGEDVKFTMSFFITNRKEFIDKYEPHLESRETWPLYKNDLCRQFICHSYKDESKALSPQQVKSRNAFLTSNPKTNIIFQKLNAVSELQEKLETLDLNSLKGRQSFQQAMQLAKTTLATHRNKRWDDFFTALSYIIFPIAILRAGWCRFYHHTWDFTCTDGEAALEKVKATLPESKPSQGP